MGSLPETNALTTSLQNTLISYHNLEENEWRIAKRSKDVTVWRKSSEEFNGFLVDHEEQQQSFVRGFNHPCGWFCVPVEGVPIQSLLTGYIQTDLRGMIPQSAVDTAMASTLVNFYSDLKRALKA